MSKNLDKELVSKGELVFIKEDNTKTLTLTDDGMVEYYSNNKLIESKPFSKLTVDRMCKSFTQDNFILQEEYKPMEDEVKYNIYVLCGENGVYNSNLVDTVTSLEQAEDRVAELSAETNCGAYYKKVVNGEELEEAQEIDINKTEQELKDQIEQVDKAQELKDELDAKIDKLLNEDKEEVMDVLNIEPGSDEEEQLDNILDTDYDLVWDELDDEERKQYKDVANSIRKLGPEEALIDVIDEINAKAKENKLENDILLFVYLNNDKLTEGVLTPIPDYLKQPSEPVKWTQDKWDLNYNRFYNDRMEMYNELKEKCFDYLETELKRDGVKYTEITNDNVEELIKQLATNYANRKEAKFKERCTESEEVTNNDFNGFLVVEYKDNKPYYVITEDDEGKLYFADVETVYTANTFNKDKAEEILSNYIDKIRESGNELKVVKYEDLMDELVVDEFPTSKQTSAILTPEDILDLNADELQLSPEQVAYLDKEEVTIQDVVNGLKDLVSQLKYTPVNEPFISIDEYINEVTRNI